MKALTYLAHGYFKLLPILVMVLCIPLWSAWHAGLINTTAAIGYPLMPVCCWLIYKAATLGGPDRESR